MIRRLIREHGHVAHTIYWTLLELVHWKGRGNRLKIPIGDLAHAACTHPMTIRKVLDSLAKTPKVTSGKTSQETSEVSSEVSPKLTWCRVGADLEIELFNFREKQENMRFKPAPNPSQTRSKTGRDRDREGDRDRKDSPSASPLGKSSPSEQTFNAQFNAFWSAYPNKTGKLKAWQSWKRFKLDKCVAEVTSAVRLQARSSQWLKMNGQYVPNPATWLNQGRWMDEIENAAQEQVEAGLSAAQKWMQKTGGSR